MPFWRCLLALLLVHVVVIVAPHARADEAGEALRRARESLGLHDPHALDDRIDLRGHAAAFGESVAFRFYLHPDGRFLWEFDGPLLRARGFDGARAWETDRGGLATELEFEDEEVVLLASWFVSGALFAVALEPSLVVTEPADRTTDDFLSIDVRLRHGLRAARVDLSRETGLPHRMRILSTRGAESVTLSDFRAVGSRTVAHRIDRSVGHREESYVVVAGALRAQPAVSFSAPPPRAGSHRFDASVPSRLETRRTASGQILVRPRLDGRDAGWFAFDSCGGETVITARAAALASLRAAASLRVADRFELGPLTIAPLVFVTADLDAVRTDTGEPLAGILGREVLERAIVEIEPSAARIDLHDPASWSGQASLPFQPLSIHVGHPLVRVKWEGGAASLFRIDTGFGGSSVVLHTPATLRLGLPPERVSDEAAAEFLGVFGPVPARLATLAELDLGSTRFTHVQALLPEPGHRGFDDAYCDGTIGLGLFRGHEIVFDYPRRRVAILPTRDDAIRARGGAKWIESVNAMAGRGEIDPEQRADLMDQIAYYAENRAVIEARHPGAGVVIVAESVFAAPTLDEAFRRAALAHPDRMPFGLTTPAIEPKPDREEDPK